MKKYYLEDGGRITASSPADFIRQLHEGSKFDSEGTDAQYILRFAERYKILTEYQLDTSSEQAFFDDLIRAGYIYQIEILNS
jgi:hypothetical protein